MRPSYVNPYICQVCKKPKFAAGKTGAVSHPLCSKKLQEMTKNVKKPKTKKSLSAKQIGYMAAMVNKC